MLPSAVPVVTSVVAKTTWVGLGCAGAPSTAKALTVVWPQSSPLPKTNVDVANVLPAEQSPLTSASRYTPKTTSGAAESGGGLTVDPAHPARPRTAAPNMVLNRRRASIPMMTKEARATFHDLQSASLNVTRSRP